MRPDILLEAFIRVFRLCANFGEGTAEEKSAKLLSFAKQVIELSI
jgi:hypothetical protein